ncbi:MAG: hypothetical protein IKM41_01865, partial [Tidjanibacter sp.]|nr:hypothetical protein [Tidjanibacter sp.]
MKLKPLFNLLTAATVSLLSALLFVQCTPAEQEFALGNGSAVIPLTVKQGTTTHFLTDYYPQWEGATTLACGDERLQLTPLTDNLDQFKITAQGGPLVSTIDVWHDWNKLSIVVLGGERDTEGSYMSSTKAKRGTITIVASKPVTEAVAMWQNEQIDNIKVDGNTIEVTIPSVAKKHQRSVVRIFAASAEGRFNDVLLPLEYGKVVVDAKDIRRQDFQSQILYS